MTSIVILFFCSVGFACSTDAKGLSVHQQPSWAKSSPQVSRQEAARTSFDRSLISLLGNLVNEMRQRGQYANGRFHPHYACWWCGDQMGTVAAILARQQPHGEFAQIAVRTLDNGLANQNPNGSFGPPTNGNELATTTEAISLGVAYLEMGSQLNAALAARWRIAIGKADHWLAGTIYYYVNGNINLQLTTALYAGYLVLGERGLLKDYSDSLHFTLSPGPKWPGFGLHYTVVPTRSLGTNGSAYLGEEGLSAPGFDPHYTMLQADYASELYLLSGQPRVLRLANLLMGQLFTRINRRTLIINTGGGSRHPRLHVSGRFESNVLPVLAFSNRPDLLALAHEQLQQVRVDFTNYVSSNGDQDQVISNYAMALIGLGAPPAPSATQ